LREAVRQHKADLLALLRADQEQVEIDPTAQLDAQRREADRQARHGYDFDPTAPTHGDTEKAEIGRLANTDSWPPLTAAGHPAYAIVGTCRQYGVALRIDEATGDLVVGRARAGIEESTQPWASLLMAIEAHLDDVALLVEAGWSLSARFPKQTAT
jgi:hypothetical protein